MRVPIIQSVHGVSMCRAKPASADRDALMMYGRMGRKEQFRSNLNAMLYDGVGEDHNP